MGSGVALAAALVAAIVFTPIARRVSFAMGVLDRPGPLKTHSEPVAYLGGVAVFAALCVALVPTHPAWLVPLGLAAALGVTDDVRTISPPARLLMQASIGGIAGVIEPAPGRFGLLATAAFVVILVNAVNLIDGMDGLASIVVGISAAGFAVVGGGVTLPALAICGALLGFLVFNRPPARIYLGDGGSYLLGTALALLAAHALHGQHPAAWVALPLFVAAPLADTATAIVRRQRSGRSWLTGDRSHVYNQLTDRGWPIVHVLLAGAAVQAAAVAAGLLTWHLGAGPAVGVAAVCAAGACITIWKSGFTTEGAPT